MSLIYISDKSISTQPFVDFGRHSPWWAQARFGISASIVIQMYGEHQCLFCIEAPLPTEMVFYQWQLPVKDRQKLLWRTIISFHHISILDTDTDLVPSGSVWKATTNASVFTLLVHVLVELVHLTVYQFLNQICIEYSADMRKTIQHANASELFAGLGLIGKNKPHSTLLCILNTIVPPVW